MEQEGVSFLKLCKVAVHRWILLLIITAGVGVAGFLGLRYGYNSFKTTYSISFKYNTPSLSKEKYADGNTFYYNSLVSSDVLNEVKSLKADYNGVDVDNMVSNNAINISRDYHSDSDSSSYISYSIVVSKRFFPSFSVAKEFLLDLSSYPLLVDEDIISQTTIDAPLEAYSSAHTFEQQIDLLSTEVEDLLSGYNSFSNVSLATRSNISTNIQQLKTLFEINNNNESTTFNVLKSRVADNGLVLDKTVFEYISLPSKKATLLSEKEYNNEVIDSIKTSLSGFESYVSINELDKVIELSARNAAIDKDVATIDKKIDGFAGQEELRLALITDLNKYKDSLVSFVSSYKSVLKAVYVDEADVVYEDASIVTSAGGLNVVLCIIIPLVFGFVVGCVVNIIVDRKDLKPQANNVKK